MDLSLQQLAQMGWESIQEKRKAGELSVRHLGIAAKGGMAYMEAIARGDIAPEPVQMARSCRCDTCPSHTEETSRVWIDGMEEGVELVKLYCGPSIDEFPDAEHPTCGCLVALRVGGKVSPAGRAIVGSRDCWQGKWPDDPPAASH
jgi:hypothetical protein